MSLQTEILEQPEVLGRLLQNQRHEVAHIAAEIRKRDIQYVFLAARGTSDNAGRYANYLWGARNGLPLALATPSLFTYYHEPPRLKGALVVGVSQSGQSPDICSVVEEGKHQGCMTLAITNAPDSPLAQTSDFVLNIEAGKEAAVAATKTYTAELMAIAMLSAALQDNETSWQELAGVSGWVSKVLEQQPKIELLAQRYRYMNRCVVLGRGYNYSTAFEWSLKMKELSYVEAEPYSSADFMHGPVAMVEQGFPVMAVIPEGKVFDSLFEVVQHLREDKKAELAIISNNDRALVLAKSPLALPREIPEWLTPLVAIIPAQLFAYHLTVVKGFNTETPRSIHKITETQ